MKLYIIRHGETQWNHLLRLQGQTDIELNENGRLLAQVTARALQKVPFTKCYTSPLSRAKETARLVLGGRQIPLVEDPRIAEISFGAEESVRVKNEDGAIVVPRYYDFFRQPDRYVAPEGGESLEALLARTGDFLRELAGMEKPLSLCGGETAPADLAAGEGTAPAVLAAGEGTAPTVLAAGDDAAALAEETILVSTHGAASRALLANIRRSALADFWDTGVPKNCAVTIVRLDPCGSGAEEDGSCAPRWVIEAQDLLFY